MSQNAQAIVSQPEVMSTGRKKGQLQLLVTVMRPHQWVKNLFILAPLLFGKRMTDISAVMSALMAFVVFCLLASAVYIFNDLQDAKDDAAHPEKRNRPISSGALPTSLAKIWAAVLVLVAGGLGAMLGWTFFSICVLYALIMIAYCLLLKRMIVLDAMTIATGFVLRVVAGAVAVNVVTTHWLIACTFLLALFLAFAKRRQELLSLSDEAAGHRRVLGSYSVEYLEQVNIIVIGAAIVCYALYTVAPETIDKFGTDSLIYGTVFVMYGMLRYLALVSDPKKGGNPSKMLLGDVPLMLTIAGWAGYNALVLYRENFMGLLFFLQP